MSTTPRPHWPWTLRLGLALIALLALATLFGPTLLGLDPTLIDPLGRLQPPSAAHWLGTDPLGRDLLARLLAGARVSLGAVGLILVLVLALGGTAGCAAGFLGGAVDAVLMRTCDAFMTIPTLVLALFLIGLLGTGMTNVVIAIVLSHWAWYARLIRGMTL